jgi:hypothetical protein
VAADVVLMALPPTARNRRLLALWARDLLPGDTAYTDTDGELLGVECGRIRRALDAEVERAADWFEVGPVSYAKAALLGSPERYLPAPTLAVHALWVAPRVLTAGLVAATTVAMNRPHRSMYRAWPRRARRQHVKRWLVAHRGWIVWAAVW